MNEKVNQFKRSSDSLLRTYHSNNPCLPKYKIPLPTDSNVIERIMRIGIECRALCASSIDEYEVIAMATLQNDFVKYQELSL